MILGTLSFILCLAWIVAFFILKIHVGYVHILLALAIILTMIRITKRPTSD